jgi:hypothetical protein
VAAAKRAMTSLPLWAGQGPVAGVQLPAGIETPPPPAWALFLSALVLVGAGLWMYHVCIRGRAAVRHSRWLECLAAAQRAEGLLRDNVSAHQYQQLLADGYLEVPSQLHPGRAYRISYQPGRVEVYEAGRPVGQLCVIACDPVPQADLILTHKWLIEADERAYLAVANWIGGSPPRRGRHGLEPRAQPPR